MIPKEYHDQIAVYVLVFAIAASGWAVFNDAGGEWLESAHEFAANAMLAVVGIHVAGVLLASKLGRENLIGAMFTGRKAGRPEDGVVGDRRRGAHGEGAALHDRTGEDLVAHALAHRHRLAGDRRLVDPGLPNPEEFEVLTARLDSIGVPVAVAP